MEIRNVHWNYCIIICSFFLLVTGCQGKKKILRNNLFFRTDSLQRIQRDSTHLCLLKNSTGIKQVTIRHVTFSPPDSLSRQFIRTLTQVEKTSGTQTAEETKLIREQREETKKSNSEKEERLEINERSPPYGSGGLPFLLLFLLFILFTKMKKI